MEWQQLVSTNLARGFRCYSGCVRQLEARLFKTGHFRHVAFILGKFGLVEIPTGRGLAEGR